MTARRPEQVLLARLVDEAVIEAEPIEEVWADLAVFGIDPAQSIRLARRLAAGATSPAGRLLGRIAEAETLDDEIRRLEQADIADVRKALPSGESAATVAHAHRASGRDTNVVGLRRRRSRRLTYGLSGVAAALAASLVLYVGMSQYRQSFQLESDAHAPAVTTNENLQARMEPAASASDATLRNKENSSAPSESLAVAAPPQSPPATALDEATARRDAVAAPEPLQEIRAADAEAPARVDPEPFSGSVAETEATGSVKSAEQPVAEEFARDFNDQQHLVVGGGGEWAPGELTGDMSANVIAPPFGIEQPVLALLVVDPKLLPAGYRQEQFSTGALATRLTDARRQAAGRRIIALVTLQYAEGIRDAVVVQGGESEPSGETKGLSVATQKTAQETVPTTYQVELLDRR